MANLKKVTLFFIKHIIKNKINNKMYTIILTCIWTIGYLKNPYVCFILYTILHIMNIYNKITNILITFPLEFYEISKELKKGQAPKHPEIIIYEIYRWIFVTIFSIYNVYNNVIYYIILSYTSSIVIGIYKTDRRIKKIYHIIWFIIILTKLYRNVNELMIGIIFYNINYIIDIIK